VGTVTLQLSTTTNSVGQHDFPTLCVQTSLAHEPTPKLTQLHLHMRVPLSPLSQPFEVTEDSYPEEPASAALARLRY